MRFDLSNYQELVIKQVKLDRDLSKWWDSQFPCKQPFLPIPTNNYSKTLEVVNARDCYRVPGEWLRSFYRFSNRRCTSFDDGKARGKD